MTVSGARHLVVRLSGVVIQTASGAPRVTPGMEELLRELSEEFTLWLLCEGPEEGLALVVEGLRLNRVIPRSHWFFISEGLRADMPKEAVEGLVARTGGSREAFLLIDDRPAVTTAVIRAGMNAVVFVDAFRLRRNLVLRGLVK